MSLRSQRTFSDSVLGPGAYMSDSAEEAAALPRPLVPVCGAPPRISQERLSQDMTQGSSSL